jgi:hypothetical protein
MAALVAKNPKLLYRLFVLLKNPSNLYGVRLSFDDKWETILVDAQFPITNEGKYYGAKPRNSNIWPMILEKAIAKKIKSYH